MDNSISKDYNELYAMLNVLPSYNYFKIPTERINYIKDHMVEDYEVDIKKMNFEQSSRKAYAMFVQIYRDYIAEEREKKVINDILELNDEKNKMSIN